MFLYGLFYKTLPTAQTKRVTAQFWLANIGAILQ